MGNKERTLYRTRIEIWSRVDPVKNDWDLRDFAGAEQNEDASVVSSVTEIVSPSESATIIAEFGDAITALRDGD